jgi:hypothetical protein
MAYPLAATGSPATNVPKSPCSTRVGWILSWRNGCYDRRQAIAATERAESGDLRTDPASRSPSEITVPLARTAAVMWW